MDEITETILGEVTISGVQVYVISRIENNTMTNYITLDLDSRIPVGLIISIPGYNQPFIYFDEMYGPDNFPNFGPNIYYYTLNWFELNFGQPQENAFMRNLFQNMKDAAHRILNDLIVRAENEIEHEIINIYVPEQVNVNNQEINDDDLYDNDTIEDDDTFDAENDITIIQNDDQIYYELMNNNIRNIFNEPAFNEQLFDIEI